MAKKPSNGYSVRATQKRDSLMEERRRKAARLDTRQASLFGEDHEKEIHARRDQKTSGLRSNSK